MPDVPVSAKKPADRKAKVGKEPSPAEQVAGSASREVEFGGHAYVVDLLAVDDVEVFEAFERVMAAADSGAADMASMASTVTLMRAVLGPEQFVRWKAEQKAVHGRVGAEVMQRFMDEALSGN